MKSFALLLIIVSCRLTPEKPPSLSEKSKHQPLSWEKIVEDAKKDRTIDEVFEISKDTIVLLRYRIGLEVSTNRGKTWTWLAKDIYHFNEFTVDNKGTWWGLERWIGIHEPSYCRINKSKDQGKTWKMYELDALKMLVNHIYSKPHKPLQVVNYRDHRVYQLSGNNPVKDWKYIKQLRDDQDNDFDLSVENYGLSRDDKLYLKKANGKTDTLITFTKASMYNLEKAKKKIYAAGTMRNSTEGYIAIINHGRVAKEFVVNDWNIRLTKTLFNHIYVMSSGGVYIMRNDRLSHIYK